MKEWKRKEGKNERKKEKERVLDMYIYIYIYMYTFLRLLYNGKHKKGARPEKEIEPLRYSAVLRCFAIGPLNRSA